ncbi:hypothetical protein [Estrella lausannensis]|uniref:Putative membrane protein n=1 Tax=Estrella lausannensis TaxID=483423 RepID=A0A0H5DQS7_9BACT|nr:hypothetical protein [Estrella lausannensis]CRX38902.1 putative membrane protein [Estrella lausannensis]
MNGNFQRLLLFVLLPLAAVGFLVAFYVHLLPIGLISDDFVLLERAKSGDSLWTIHYTWTLNWLWKWLAEGVITLREYKAVTLAVHLANTCLLYLFLVKRFSYTPFQSAMASLLLLLSASGIEALAWTCCLGYTWTLLFILASLVINASPMSKEHQSMGWLEAMVQAAALMTWDWGVLVFPLTALSALLKEGRPSLPKLFFYFLPSLLVLMAYGLLREQSSKETIYAVSSLAASLKFLFASPLIVLAPNISKEILSSFLGIVASLALWLVMLYFAVKERRSRFFVCAFILALLPWLIGGHPSSRYYYLSAPFLLSLAPLLTTRAAGGVGLTLLVIVQFYSSFERTKMWNLADREVRKLEVEFKSLALLPADGKRLLIINAPDAFGPPSFPMRPQVWHCGLETLCPEAIQVKVSPAPHIWAEGGNRVSWEEVVARYSNDIIYEVVWLPEESSGSFSLVLRNLQ